MPKSGNALSEEVFGKEEALDFLSSLHRNSPLLSSNFPTPVARVDCVGV